MPRRKRLFVGAVVAIMFIALAVVWTFRAFDEPFPDTDFPRGTRVTRQPEVCGQCEASLWDTPPTSAP